MPAQRETRRTPRTKARAGGVALAAALLAVMAPAAARGNTTAPGNRDRVVHGVIGMPSLQPITTTEVVVPVGPAVVAVPSTSTAASCAVPDSEWVIDRVRPGHVFELTADAGPHADDFDIAFFASERECQGATPPTPLPYRNAAGDERAVVPDDAKVAVVTLVSGSRGAAFTYRELAHATVKFPDRNRQKPTVIAVMELAVEGNGYNPYHFDFLGHQHPWNTDEELENDLDFDNDPGAWLPGYSGATPLPLTLPKADQPDANIAQLHAADADTWKSMKASTAKSTNIYRFPGTKVVGAASFLYSSTSSVTFFSSPATTAAHGTRSASVAGGNTHGTCPACVFVLVSFDSVSFANAATWAAAQPWIDVVTNSWASRAYVDLPAHLQQRVVRPAVEAGQTWIWAAGNGMDDTFLVPNPTYTWQSHAADWNILVGGVTNPEDREAGAGKPVHISSYSNNYPSSGGGTANATGFGSGTSIAAPVVAGTFAQIVQWGRELLGDTSPGHRAAVVDGKPEGIVAEGAPRPCDGSLSACPLDDGVFTQSEVRETLFGNVLPSSMRPPGGLKATRVNLLADEYLTTPPLFASAAQGHGIVRGKWDTGRYTAETRRLLDAVRGAIAPFTRPPGETNWMVVDSKCRQRLWGTWNNGYYTHPDPDPQFDPTVDQLAIALNAACTPLWNGAAVQVLPQIK